MPPPAPYGQPPPYGYGWPPPYGQPPGYPPPAPYYMPPPPPPGQKTFEALDKFTRATTFAIYGNIVTAAVGAVTLGILFAGGALAATFASSGGGLVAGILQLVAFVYGVIGISAFRDGKREFGPDHERNVDRGWRFFLIAVVVYIGGIVVSVVVVVVGIFAALPPGGGAPDPAAFTRMFQEILIAAAVIAVIGVYVTALCLQSFIQSLMRRPGRESSSSFIGLSLAAAVVSGALIIVGAFMFPLTMPQQGVAAQATTPINLAPLASVVAVVALSVYKRQLGEAVAGARAMVGSRTFDPDAPTVVAAAPLPSAPPAYPG